MRQCLHLQYYQYWKSNSQVELWEGRRKCVDLKIHLLLRKKKKYTERMWMDHSLYVTYLCFITSLRHNFMFPCTLKTEYILIGSNSWKKHLYKFVISFWWFCCTPHSSHLLSRANDTVAYSAFLFECIDCKGQILQLTLNTSLVLT